MSGKHHMEKSEQCSFEAALAAKQAELLRGLRERDGLTAEAEPDVFDEIQHALDRALLVQTLDRNSRLLRQVRAALERLAEGTYGQCLQCEEPINPKRLVALPWAQFCLPCQEEADREERQQMLGADSLRAA
jgi:DnaK suppressor protein